MNNGDRADKTYLTGLWPNIVKTNPAPALQATATLLGGGVLAASSKDKIIVTFSSCRRVQPPDAAAGTCARLSKRSSRTPSAATSMR
ncbi:MAG: hypothetical protein MZU95_14370 [Desulfomicrobium escambiense]|nr:hypothetical protein [Desulfomicrobium escambiense]